jgi:tRNA(His) guanylyltransferase
VVLYPTDAAVKDYVRWRQVDAHINNLYNTTFWKLVRELQGVPVVHPKEQQQQQPQQQHLQDGASPNGLSEREAREQAHALMHSHYASSAEKNEVLFSRFHCNYNDEPAEFRKGTILVWKEMPPAAVAIAAADAQRRAESQASSGAAAAAAEAEQATPKASSPAPSPRVVWQLHCDVISDEFWTSNFPGIVPYAGAPGHERKQQKKEEKKAKRQAYRERDAKERNNAQQQQQQQQKQQTNASAGAAVAAPSAVPSAAAAAAAAAAVPNGVPHQTSSHATAPLPTANATAVERPPPSLDAKAGEGRQQQQKQQTNAGGQVS